MRGLARGAAEAGADAALARLEPAGLALGGHRVQVTLDDPWPLAARPGCVERDVFALPPAPGAEPG
jgi:hypothetical protein